jgi:hypothetical protein
LLLDFLRRDLQVAGRDAPWTTIDRIGIDRIGEAAWAKQVRGGGIAAG